MRLAFVDLFFSWPPHGGACIDLYYTALGLKELGHDIHLFLARYGPAWERGRVDPANFPLPCTALEFSRATFTRRRLPARFREAVDAWRPDAVFICDAFFLKPYLIDALAHYPAAGRYYAYEVSCPRDFRRFKNGAPCPLDYLRTPNACRRCTVQGLKTEILRGRPSAWTHEYLAGSAFMPGYHEKLAQSLQKLDVIIVYNDIQQRLLQDFPGAVHVVPGGIDLSQFQHCPVQKTERPERKIILMVGRAEDPLKGMDTLRRAAERLAAERSDFEVWVTHPDYTLNTPFFKAVGWRDHDEIMKLYRQADICVVPSLWGEPFGMVAVEAMATGRPLCASRSGGLQGIVVDGETGFLFDPGDVEALEQSLQKLLDDADLRRRMGEAGRRRVETDYDWKAIVKRYYPPILERLKK